MIFAEGYHGIMLLDHTISYHWITESWLQYKLTLNDGVLTLVKAYHWVTESWT